MRIGIVVPHIFMHGDILPQVIFSPADLAIGLCTGLQDLGADVTLFSPGPVHTSIRNLTADLSLFKQELQGRGYDYTTLLKKHPATFIALARQVQSELIAKAYAMANAGKLDLVHIYTNEEDLALPFAQLCTKPVVFTHHDPFNFLIRYKSVFPKYKHLNWISLSLAQRAGMPPDTNWIANIYHGLDEQRFAPNYHPLDNYVAYLGRIVEPKGLHLAIAAVQAHNRTAKTPLSLKIAGKHYAEHQDSYWQEQIAPKLDDPYIEYVGFINSDSAKQDFLGNAQALLVPSVFEEPFGMVLIEALACGTPIVGLDSGAIPEIVTKKTGIVVTKQPHPDQTVQVLTKALTQVQTLNRLDCRKTFQTRFTQSRMCQDHLAAYKLLTRS